MLYGLFIVILPLFIGYQLQYSRPSLSRWLNRITSYCLYLILLVMGFSLGQLSNLSTQLPHIVTSALVLSLAIQASNILFLMVYDKYFPMKRNQQESTDHFYRTKLLVESFKLLLVIIFGGLLGYICKNLFALPSHTSTVILVLMIFCVGAQLRNSGITLRQVFLNQRGVIATIIFAFSSLLGASIVAPWINLSQPQAMAMASGFGWYSLSSVMMSDAWGATYGSIAFFNDLAREIFCLFSIPLLIRYFPTTAVGVGGATSLDCTLPIIQKSGGIGVVPLAISFGFLTNLLSPLLMAIFIEWG